MYINFPSNECKVPQAQVAAVSIAILTHWPLENAVVILNDYFSVWAFPL